PSAKAAVNGRLDQVVFRALEREPERRYQRVSEVRTALETVTRDGFSWPRELRRGWKWVRQMGRDLARRVWAVVEELWPFAKRKLTPAESRQQVRALAVALAVVAFVGLLSSLWWAGDKWFPLFAAFTLSGVFATTIVQTWRLRYYDWAVGALVLAVAPWSYHFLLGVPVAVWGFLVLRRPEVRAIFVAALPAATPNVAAEEPSPKPS